LRLSPPGVRKGLQFFGIEERRRGIKRGCSACLPGIMIFVALIEVSGCAHVESAGLEGRI